jgi:hypothetical protein
VTVGACRRQTHWQPDHVVVLLQLNPAFPVPPDPTVAAGGSGAGRARRPRPPGPTARGSGLRDPEHGISIQVRWYPTRRQGRDSGSTVLPSGPEPGLGLSGLSGGRGPGRQSAAACPRRSHGPIYACPAPRRVPFLIVINVTGRPGGVSLKLRAPAAPGQGRDPAANPLYWSFQVSGPPM